MLSSKPAFHTLSFMLCTIFVSALSGASINDHNESTSIQGVVEGRYNGGVSWGNGRSLRQGNSGRSSSLILAADRTHRKDPSNSFKYYTGGWNISNEHYIYSVAFTGAPLFCIAAVWFVGFGLTLLLIWLCYCCCKRRSNAYSPSAYILSLLFLSIFTIAAIIGSVVLYTGLENFHNSTKGTLDFVVSQAGSTAGKLRNVSDVLDTAKITGVAQIFLPEDVKKNIDKVGDTINSSVNTLDTETRKNKKDILHVIDLVRQILIIIAALMLFLAALGFFLSVSGPESLVYILVIIGWILIAATLILSSVFVLLHNVVEDTCVAMDEWAKNPKVHTALDDIIPCVDPKAAQETLSQSKEVTFEMVVVVNRIINNVANANMPTDAPTSYNQSGPLVPNLCSPFNSDNKDKKCAEDEVEFGNAPEVWKKYVCNVGADNVCTTVGRLTPDLYNQMNGAVKVSGGLYQYGPFLTDLLDCTFLRSTFNTIHDHHCPDLELFSKWVYIGLVLISAFVCLSIIFWVLHSRERSHRKYTKLAGP
ncbi:unnamed protein product [Cuscuta epithymum]|uniref:Uncharacterized protein n=1 Tax=Cuscuta epithymum TaxID=186058 RepID=A0AAV0CEK1_9ASTE|nr:unnamed protein product [Cuscuta epithymum]